MRLFRNPCSEKNAHIPHMFWVSETGAATVIFGLALVILIGSFALMIDVARVFAVKSHLATIGESTALAVARNLNFLTAEQLEEFAIDIVSSASRNTSVFTHNDRAFSTTTSVITGLTKGQARIIIRTKVPTTLLRFFNLFDDINVSQTVTAYQYAPNAEIVIVLESSKEMERSGKLANTRDAVKDFVTVFDGHRKADSGVTFGFIPFGNDLVNVAPHTEWLEGGVWPVEIPPKVPGTTDWIGDLADDRWCVLKRPSTAGILNLTPGQSVFSLELDILKTEGGGGIAHYTNVTSTDCRAEPIVPLTKNTATISQSILSLVGSGDVYAGRAMVWAERILSPAWQPFWQTTIGTPSGHENEVFKNVVIFIAGSANTSPETEDGLFIDVCDRLKTNGAAIYVIDYLAPRSFTDLLADCATTKGHYFRVENDTSVSEALYAIAKFLTVVRFSG
ncbi:MAG: hypothetical protein V7727_08840 [Sneathiella sp.]